jgi:U3 small nucleolar RNA-associated protein 12
LKNGNTSLGLHVVSACNEVVYLMNNNTSEIAYKIYDTEAQYGHVTRLQVSGDNLAVGYSSGTIIVFDLDVANAQPDEDNTQRSPFNVLHRFSFHKTAVTCMFFEDNNTQLYSGSQDTYIVVYDLVSDSA